MRALRLLPALLMLLAPLGVRGQTMVNLIAPTSTSGVEFREALAAVNVDRSSNLIGDPTSLEEWNKALQTAQKNENAFTEFLRYASRTPRTSEGLSLPNTDVGRAVRIALYAVNPQAYYTLLEQVDRSLHSRFDAVRLRLIDRVEAVAASSARPYVRVFADGSISGVARGEKSDSPVGTGALGVSVVRSYGTWVGQVVVASTQDTTTSSFGYAILSPTSGLALASGFLDFHSRHTPVPFPFHLYASASRSLWRYSEPGTGTEVTRGAAVLGIGALFYNNLALGSIGENEVGLKGEIGISTRILGGDIVRERREAALGDGAWAAAGLEAGLQITFGRVVGAVQMYLYSSDSKHSHQHIDGLSGLQVLAGFSISGEIFKGELIEAN